MSMWQIICDFDGTMVDLDITDAILERFAHPDWIRIEEAWLAGEFGSKECMGRQVALLNVSKQELDDFLDTVELDPAFAAFANWCIQSGFPLSVVSDGIDYSIRYILTRHKLGHIPIIANKLVMLENDRYELKFPYAHSTCTSGVCKCHVAQSENYKTLLIGDGHSDFCLARNVDLIFGRKKLLAYCVELGLPHLPCHNFHDALELAKNTLSKK